jgi:quaternary ammonium compound-resistance protein SugE
MAWTYLILAGLCEVVYAALLKKTQGFTQSLPTEPLPRCGGVDLRAARPCRPRNSDRNRICGISAVGIAGAATVGIVLYHEPATALRLFFLVTLISSIIGLKLATPT